MATWTSGYVTDLGYTSGFYRELAPSTLAFAAMIKGIRAPDPSSRLRYCELGCGQGVSSALLAAANPHIEIFANDFNPGHVVAARRLATEAGLQNAHFYEHSFSEFGAEPSLPDAFEIISLHGIYSWVSEENRRHITEFIRRKLAPGGLVYISYNALPGWAAAAPMRHLMYLRGRDVGGPTARRLKPALDLVQSLIDAEAGYFRANPTLKDRFEKLKSLSPNYLAHEYLNEAWTLLYHAEVAEELSHAKLSFVGSAHVLDEIETFGVTEAQSRLLKDVSDPILRETLKDFMTNQQFRRDVFAKGAATMPPSSASDIWGDLRVALTVPRPLAVLSARGARGEMKIQANVAGPLLDVLASGPKTIRELTQDPRLSGLGLPHIQQAVAVLVGSNQVAPCVSAQAEAAAREQAQRFNSVVIGRSLQSGELVNLASPVTGSGITVDRTVLLFLQGQRANAPDLSHFAWQTLKSQGQRLIKDGKPILDDAENVEELQQRLSKFNQHTMPLLQQLGSIP